MGGAIIMTFKAAVLGLALYGGLSAGVALTDASSIPDLVGLE